MEAYCLSVDVRVLVSGTSESVDGFGSNFQSGRIDCILSTSSTAEGAQGIILDHVRTLTIDAKLGYQI